MNSPIDLLIVVATMADDWSFALIAWALVFIILLAAVWRWAVFHEAGIKQRWKSFLNLPGVERFRHRFASQLDFLQRRISRHGYLGLHLTVGIVILFAACWAFCALAEDVVHHDPIVVVDQSIAAWFHGHATPDSTRALMAISFLGSGAWIASVAVLIAIYLCWRRAWDDLLLLFLVSGCGGVVNVLIKSIFHRTRPVFENPIQTLASYSFPSGHTMAATLFYGLMAVFAVVHLLDWSARVLAVLLAIAMILLIGLSRIALVVHYFSDVLGGIAAGVVWLAFCVTAVGTLRRRRKWLEGRHPESG